MQKETQEETGRIIDFCQQAVFGKGTEDTSVSCKIALGSFCGKNGREAQSSMILPIILGKLWPVLVTAFGLPELKTEG